MLVISKNKSLKKRLLAATTALVLLLTAILPFMITSAAPAAPVAVDGRVLTPDQTGDRVNWVEIAQYNGSSLIVRADYIRLSGYNNYAEIMQYTSFGTDTKYSNSFVRNKINHWFAGVADYANWEDVLPLNARLRDYTLQHNALGALGTCNSIAAMSDGLSTPTKYQVGIGADIAFALSYSESANFLSSIHFQRNNNLANQPSNAIAIANVNKISIPETYLSGMYLRSVGDVPNTVGALDNEGKGNFRVFQFYITTSANQKGFVYPALWVDEGIFPPVITHYDVNFYANNGTGEMKKDQALKDSNYLILDQGFTNPGYTFAGWNTEANGTGTTYQNFSVITVTGPVNLYAQWTRASSIVYHINAAGSSEIYTDYGNNGNFTIMNNMFVNPPYNFSRWTSDPAGVGAILPPGLSFGNFYGTLHLYAQWYTAS